MRFHCTAHVNYTFEKLSYVIVKTICAFKINYNLLQVNARLSSN